MTKMSAFAAIVAIAGFAGCGSGGVDPRGIAQCGAAPITCGGGQSCGAIDSPSPPDSLPAEATTCSPTNAASDGCGCNGKTCSSGQICVQFDSTGSFGGGGIGIVNSCVAACTSATDCGPGNECRPSSSSVFECGPAQCHSDADCTDDACGHCVPEILLVNGGMRQDPEIHACVYVGACGTSSCASCGPATYYNGAGQPPLHRCDGRL